MRVTATIRVAMCLMAFLTIALFVPARSSATDNKGWKWLGHHHYGYNFYITYKFANTVPSVYRTAINNGRDAWNSAGRELLFVWDPNGQVHQNPQIVVRYDDLWWPFECKYALAEHSSELGKIVAGEITFNDNICNGQYYFYYGTGSPIECNYLDLWSGAAHEFGHLVELQHSSQSADTMHETLLCGTTNKRSLTSHDLAGINDMYGDH